MGNIQITKLNYVEAPTGEYVDIIAFQMCKFTIDFYGHKETFCLDTKITADGQFVIDGNGFIPTGYQVKD